MAETIPPAVPVIPQPRPQPRNPIALFRRYLAIREAELAVRRAEAAREIAVEAVLNACREHAQRELLGAS